MYKAPLLLQKASKSIENENRKQKQVNPYRRNFFRSFPDAAHRVLLDFQMGTNPPGNEPNRQSHYANA